MYFLQIQGSMIETCALTRGRVRAIQSCQNVWQLSDHRRPLFNIYANFQGLVSLLQWLTSQNESWMFAEMCVNDFEMLKHVFTYWRQPTQYLHPPFSQSCGAAVTEWSDWPKIWCLFTCQKHVLPSTEVGTQKHASFSFIRNDAFYI